jgi:hypothetical protein
MTHELEGDTSLRKQEKRMFLFGYKKGKYPIAITLEKYFR